jgi:hypothetical protein
MRKLYVGLTGLLLLALVVQFYLAATGAFTRPQDDGSFALHDLNGTMVIPLLTVLAVVAAALAKAPGRLIGLTALPLGLVIAQILIVVLGRALNGYADTTTPVGVAIMGLHALNGLALLGVAATVLRRARALAAGATGATPADATRPAVPTV